MKQIIRITESDLHEIIKEAVSKIIKEDIGPKHYGHNLDDFLDDKDFVTIANRVISKFGYEYLSELYFSDDAESYDEAEIEIAQMVKDFVEDEAVHAFGYKYGSCNYRTVASNILEYLKKELYKLYK
jgi:F420-0:gamma-glutamyl ligase